MDGEKAYSELGGTGLPPMYADAIKNHCTVCHVIPGQTCLDENGRDRRRPHGSRMVTRTGWSDVSTETSSPSNPTESTNTSSTETTPSEPPSNTPPSS